MTAARPGWSRADRWWLLPAAWAAVLAVGAARFALAERTLYAADRIAHWVMASGLAELARSHPLAALAAIARSLATSDLNLLPAALPAAVMALLGSGRPTFVAAVASVYGLATAIALVAVARRHLDGRPAAVAVALTVALPLFPTLWRPVLLGAVGLGGVALGVVVLLLTWTGSTSLKRAAGAGLVLAVLVLFRRWYLLWAVGWLAATVVVVMVRARLEPAGGWRRLVRAPVATAGVAAVVAAALSLPVILQRASSGYADEFAGFRRLAGLGPRLAAVADELGLVALAVVAAALVTLWRRRETRPLAAGLLLQPVVCWLGMVRLQDHDLHHWYLYMPALTFAVAAALPRWVGQGVGPGRRRAVIAALAVSGLLQSAAVGWPAFGPVAARVAPLLPRVRVEPAVRHDLAEVRRLLESLDRALASGPGPIYVLASSELLSDQILGFAPRSLGHPFESPRAILGSAHVDRRDGFPAGLLRARYVVVADPPQIHLRPEEQQVVLVPAASFAGGTDVALAFAPWTENFALDGGVTVRVYERTRSHTEDEVAALAARLEKAHPDLPSVYTPW